MLDPGQLIQVALLLVENTQKARGVEFFNFEAHFRRAVSTAYYALFHKIAGAAASEFADPRREYLAAYRLIYRGLDHQRMKKVFTSVQSAELSPATRSTLGRDSVSQGIRDVASAFVKLQEARHAADYDPKVFITRYDAVSLVDMSAQAILEFDAVDRDERKDLLAWLLVGARG